MGICTSILSLHSSPLATENRLHQHHQNRPSTEVVARVNSRGLQRMTNGTKMGAKKITTRSRPLGKENRKETRNSVISSDHPSGWSTSTWSAKQKSSSTVARTCKGRRRCGRSCWVEEAGYTQSKLKLQNVCEEQL